MNPEKRTFRLIGHAPGTPRDLLVEDTIGTQRLFIGSTGTVTSKPLHPELITALFRRGRLHAVTDDAWYSLDELRTVASDR